VLPGLICNLLSILKMSPSAFRVSSPPGPGGGGGGQTCTKTFLGQVENGHTDVYLSVGMWRANGNPNPCTNLDEILHALPHLFKVGFGAGLTPTPTTSVPGGA